MPTPYTFSTIYDKNKFMAQLHIPFRLDAAVSTVCGSFAAGLYAEGLGGEARLSSPEIG